MEIPFDVACRFMYRPKTSYDEYEKNGLNELLEKMYYKYRKSLGALAPLHIFNASYAIAVALVNTPNIARKDISHDIEKFVSDTFRNLSTGDGKYHKDTVLCIGLAFCILRLQEENPDDSRDYLRQFSGRSGIMAVDRMFVRMVLNTGERFYTDLHPCAPKVEDLTDDLWENTISRFSDEDFEEALTYYRTKEEQLEFLRRASMEVRKSHRDSSHGVRGTWKFSATKCKELRKRIDAGEFLDHSIVEDVFQLIQKGHNQVCKLFRKGKDELCNSLDVNEDETQEEQDNLILNDAKELVKFCVDYASDIEKVADDSHAESIKLMLEEIMYKSPWASQLGDSDKAELGERVHTIPDNRRQANAIKRAKEKEESRIIHQTNNYNGPIGQNINSANHVRMEKQRRKNN